MHGLYQKDADLPTVRATFDAALEHLGRVRDDAVDVSGAATAVVRALHRVYEAMAAGASAGFSEGRGRAMDEAGRALEILQATPSNDPAIDAVLSRLAHGMGLLVHATPIVSGSGPRLPHPDRTPPPPLASVGEPRVVAMARPVLPPFVTLGAADPTVAIEYERFDDPPVATRDEVDRLMAEARGAAEAMDAGREPVVPSRQVDEDAMTAPHGRSAPTEAEIDAFCFGSHVADRTATFGHARTAVEELATLGALRRPNDDRGWGGRAESERRLLARVDAIVACGADVLPGLFELLADRPVPDPELVWALVFLCGTIEGDDLVEQALRLARTVPLEEPSMRHALADAFALAPAGAFDKRLRPWIRDERWPIRWVAAEALRRRLVLDGADVERLSADPAIDVVRVAAAAIGTARGEVLSHVLGELLGHLDHDVARGAIAGAMRRGEPAGLRRAGELCRSGRGEHGDAILYYAIGGAREALDELREAAMTFGGRIALEAIGWYGHLELVAYLLSRLDSEDAEIQSAAAGALERITGAGLTAESPAPRYDDDAQPFAPSSASAPQKVALLSTDPAAWRAWWETHERRADRRVRYRFGRPWRPFHNTWEIDHPLSTRRDRSLSHLELRARLGITEPFDGDLFVAAQRRQIADLRRAVRERPGSAVTMWPTSMAR